MADVNLILRNNKWHFITAGVILIIVVLLIIFVRYFSTDTNNESLANDSCDLPVTYTSPPTTIEEQSPSSETSCSVTPSVNTKNNQKEKEEEEEEEVKNAMKATDELPLKYFAELLVGKLVADAKIIAAKNKNPKPYYRNLMVEIYAKFQQLAMTLPPSERIRGNVFLGEIKKVIQKYENQQEGGSRKNCRTNQQDVMNLVNKHENLICIVYPSLIG